MHFLYQTIKVLLCSGKPPSARAIAAYFKIRGIRLERRWPFFIRAEKDKLNLYIEDLLEFEASRNTSLCCMSIGAYDGIENDPLSHFIRNRRCQAILLEPQKKVFERLKDNYREYQHCLLVNKAVDEISGERDLYVVSDTLKGQPSWASQIASFDLNHVTKHEDILPGVSHNIRSERIKTISFPDLLDEYDIESVHILQIDAEGMDDRIIKWIPFSMIKPGLLIFEIAHMNAEVKSKVNFYLEELGYKIFPMNSGMDAAAVLL